ncbi:Flagellar hook-associated protein 2 N-terminus [Marinospirillum celere]|uniref:Flagellar hook-associated protein 2 n=1 Tax=Marinospirillum celere TaxID=1122252 RepID=A0A1I1GYW1_9GAMM|nr:flagellar filament capping protein FliD [Marinospirillum celere]SFC14353.1 Flagellar hook-associated protein 2 N-terminus [Marinospirillum celere]
MSGISFNGVGSGLPVNDIIKATVQAESAPLKRLQNDKQFFNSQISALGQLSSRLGSLRSAMLDLRGMDKFQVLAADSGNEKLFTSTADHLAGAKAGNYSIEVLAEARNYRHVSESLSKTATYDGELTFLDANNDPLLDTNGNAITIDTTGKTLDQIRSAINNHADLSGKVSANLVNENDTQGRLVINSQVSGEKGRITAEFTNVDLADKDDDLSTKATDNLDARIKIDGIEASSSTNNFSNVISGVSINITPGAMNEASQTSTLQIQRDDDTIKDNIDAFVKAYNDVIIHLNEAKKGSLYGDSTTRDVEAQMRDILYTPTQSKDGDPEKTQQNMLALMGIEMQVNRNYDPENPDSQNGTLKIDREKLTEALNNDFDRVALTIGGSSFLDDDQPDGYAQRFADMAQRLTTTTSEDGQIRKGLLEIRREGLRSEVNRIDDRIESTNMRLDLLEQRLYRQFNAIEGMIANLNSTGNFIGQQLAGLPGYSRPSR